MDILYIDGLDAKTTWGITPLCDKFYSSIMKYPDAKERVISDYNDEDGINVFLSEGKIKSSETTLSFLVDTYQGYLDFCDYMMSHPVFELTTFSVDKGILYEYMSHTEFNYRRSYFTFGIKLREANFKNRKYIYLVTENNDYICTETGDKIIL